MNDSDTLSITTDASSDGVPDKPSGTARRARTVNSFDDQGRVYRSEVYSVSPSDGSLSANTLKTDFWFDHRGNLIKVATPGQGVSKVTYDGLGRVVKQFLTDGNADTTWGHAGSVSDDRVVAQSETQYDANSNPIFVISKQRFSELQSSTTGELGTATTGVLARVSYSASYYDSADRLTSVIDVGTNGGSAYTRPGSVPARSDTVLRTDFSYNGAGWLEDVTDPRGLVNRTQYDNLGRSTRVIEGYVDGTPSAGDDRTTEYTYDGNDNLRTVKAVLPSGAYQTTEYVYGASTGAGSDLNSNDVRTLVKRPDASTGDPSTAASDQESFTVNALGETKTATDRNGNVHTYAFDVVGRLFSDAVTTLGSGVDGTIRRLETAFDTGGRAYLFTSYDAASGGNIKNQVQREFNGLGQLTKEYQEHAGAVNTGTSAKVQYAYSEMSGGANHSRLTSVTYPNGRQINYVYTGGWDGAIHDALSRVFQEVENSSGQVLEQLGYLGAATPVYRNHPFSGVNQVFAKQSGESNGDAGDPYTGYDRFDRVVEARWRNGTNERVRVQYGYDRDGNRLYADNLVNNTFDELYHADGVSNGYDGLNRLTEYQRGALSDANSDGIPDTVTSAGRSQVWSLDAQGNWSSVTNDGVTQTRGHNKKNRITSISGQTTPTYDQSGNTTGDETGQRFVYDAWNRLVVGKTSGGTTIATFTYDPLSRRQSEDEGGAARHLYYSAAWQVLEERVGGVTKVQNLWSPVYVDALIERDRDADGNAGNGLEERLWALQDANYNVVALANSGGSVVERYVYDAYGQRYVFDASWGSRASSSYAFVEGYQGLRHDDTIAKIDVRYRWLSWTLGRPMQEDPLGFAAGYTNLYVWIGSNPVNGLDPLGLDVFDPNITHWHHLIPQQFKERLTARGLEHLIHAADNGWYLLGEDHRQLHEYRTRADGGPMREYNADWERFFREADKIKDNKAYEEALRQQVQQMKTDYGLVDQQGMQGCGIFVRSILRQRVDFGKGSANDSPGDRLVHGGETCPARRCRPCPSFTTLPT